MKSESDLYRSDKRDLQNSKRGLDMGRRTKRKDNLSVRRKRSDELGGRRRWDNHPINRSQNGSNQ